MRFFFTRFYICICLLYSSMGLVSTTADAQNDLPGPSSNIQSIKVGSLVIGMDTITQVLPGYFNLKAYGLVNKLLQNNIPVMWAIKAGKLKDGADFTVTAQQIYPGLLASKSYTFRAGPFIIDSAYEIGRA